MESPKVSKPDDSDKQEAGRFQKIGLWILGRIRAVFTGNIYLKAMAFALATVLWAMVASDQSAEETVQVLLDVEPPDGLVLLTPPPPAVSVHVVGARSKLKLLKNLRLEISVDLRDAKPPEMIFRFAGKRIRNLPSGVNVASFNPSVLNLQFDEESTQSLRVVARIEGDAGPGYRYVTSVLDPAQVQVIGPKGKLADLEEVNTEPIKISGQTKSMDVTVPLDFRSPYIHVLDGKEQVRVQVKIEAKIEQRVFEQVAVEIPETLERCVLTPALASVTLEGPKEVVEAISPSDLRFNLEEVGDFVPDKYVGSHRVRYPPSKKQKGLPRLHLDWPRSDVVRLIRLHPSQFELKVLPAEVSPAGDTGSSRDLTSKDRKE